MQPNTSSSIYSWYWILDCNGDFTVKSCYRKLRGESECYERDFWKKLWSLKLPGKVLNFLWRACQNVLPTAYVLSLKNVSVLQTCTWCHLHNEDSVHTLFTYCFAREVWNSVGLQGIGPEDENYTVLQILKKVFSTSTSEQCARVGLLCWGLWVRRNSWVWDKKSMSVFGVNAMISNLLQDWRRVQEEQTGSKTSKLQGKWCKPPQGWVKINVDAACHIDSDHVGVGCVVRDDRGQFLRARNNQVRGRMQPREAEAWSLKEALNWTRGWRTSRCIFEMDAKLVVNAIHGNRGNSNFHTIIEECVEILKHFEEVLVTFDYRSANKVAHMLAQAAYSMPGLMEWYYTAPDFICNLISEEV